MQAPLDDFNRQLALTAISTARRRGRAHIGIRVARQGAPRQTKAFELNGNRDPGNELDRATNGIMKRFPGERNFEVVAGEEYDRLTGKNDPAGSAAEEAGAEPEQDDNMVSIADPGSYGFFDADPDAGIDGGYPA